MAAIAVEHGNAPGAEKLCAVAAQTGHRSCWLAVLEARVALLKQDQERARERALAAKGMGTDDPHIANQLGVALSRTGRHAEAVSPFRTAVEGCADNPDYRYNLAVALQFAGELEAAEDEFRALVAMQPEHARGWVALAQLAKRPEPEWDAHLVRLFSAAKDSETRLTIGHALARWPRTARSGTGRLNGWTRPNGPRPPRWRMIAP